MARALTILVTGSSSGFGRVISEELAARGGYLRIFEAFSVKQGRELFERNVFSVLRLNRVVLPHMSREMQTRRPAAGDPREVAEAVADLIELPAGSRPLRTTVEWGVQRADGLNAVSQELQQGVLDGLGVREQLTLAGGQPATTEV